MLDIDDDSSDSGQPDRSTPTMAPDAYFGLAGDIVKAIEPHTEADPVALLLSFLTMYGNVIGAGPHADLGSSPQPGRLFTVLVGDTATGRKGTAGDEIEALMNEVDTKWSNESITHGFQSAEGLVAAVDDRIGVRRLMWIESEFGRLIDTLNRRANMADHMKQAFDGKKLSIRTKQLSGWLTASHPHISVLGHVTPTILADRLSPTELASGFANRFLFAKVERSKILPRPTKLSDNEFDTLVERIENSIDWINMMAFEKVDPISSELYHSSTRIPSFPITLSDAALNMWDNIYMRLSNPEVGVIGEVTARGSTQIIRLAVLFALTDTCTVIQPVHLKAALAIWDYCERSVRMIFGSVTGDRRVDRLLKALDSAPDKTLALSQIRDALGSHNISRAQMKEIMGQLPHGEEQAIMFNDRMVFITRQTIETGGRPRQEFTLRNKETEGV